MARVVVVGLGPAGADLLTAAAADALDRIPQRYLRTERHPAATVATWTATFDQVYESAGSLDEVYGRIVDALIEAAGAYGEVLYAVPGSPDVAERTVELLRADRRVDVHVVPALSFLDLTWNRLGVDPIAIGVRVVDGHRFAVEAAGERGPLLVAQCDSVDVLSEVKLAFGDDPPAAVTVIQRLGLPDESVFDVAGADLDRSFVADHLTSLWIPTLAAPVATELARFGELVRTLRERCPWDAEQTHRTLTRHLLEETYEVLEAIEGLPESVDHLEEELGDLLFQVYFHATIGAEEGNFTLADIARGIHDKLVRRHPHVFADASNDPDEVVATWEQIKKAEKGAASVMDGVAGNLPSLLYAHKIQRKAASLGVESDTGALEVDPPEAVDDELVGTLLFGLVGLARTHKVDPEAALRAAAARFRDEVAAAEVMAAERGEPVSVVWEEGRRER